MIPSWLVRGLGMAALVATLAGFACDQKVSPSMMVRPDQRFLLEMEDPPAAARACANWTWAAALESLLRRQNVDLKQDFWILRAHGGLVCLPQAGSAAELARAIDGDYTLNDGRKVRLQARYSNGPPTSVDELILRLHGGHPILLFWNSQVYLLHGVVYDEYIAPTGERLFQVRVLNLLNPHPQARERATVFDRARHDVTGIQAVMDVVVTFDQGTDWLRKNSN